MVGQPCIVSPVSWGSGIYSRYSLPVVKGDETERVAAGATAARRMDERIEINRTLMSVG